MSKHHQSSKPNSPFSPFPILPPLLCSFNAPAPVIIPPGSDPCLFDSNDQVLETSCLMDVDPCVVAWRESVTNKVDLTASEHAGVSLSEPAAMVSTTSTDSEAVARQALNITSEDVFMKHMEENIHLTNTEKIVGSSTINQESEKKNQDLENITKVVSTVIEQETPSFVPNSTLDQESEKKKQDSLQKEAMSKSLNACEYPESLFVCDIAEPGRAYQKIATVEMDESLFKNLTSRTSVSMIPVERCNGGTQNRPTELTVRQHNWCDICKVICSGDKSFEKHIAGKQHQNNLKISEKTPTPPLITSRDTTPITKTMQESMSMDIGGKQHQNNLIVSEKTPTPQQTAFVASRGTTPVTKIMVESNSVEDKGKSTWCEICKVNCSNVYATHLSGKKHIKNLQKLEKLPNLPSTVIDSPLAEKLKLAGGEVVNPNEGNSLSCELCGVHCTSRDMLNIHILGKKHQKNLKQTEQQFVSSPAHVPKTPLPEPMNEEGETVFLKGSKRKGNDSLSSKEDSDTKRQKVNEEEESCGVLVTCKVCNVGCNGLMGYKTHICRL